MKKLLSAILGLLLVSACACAEAIPSPTPAILLVTPTPSPAPTAAVFSSEDLIVTLPLGMEIMQDDEMAGYDAAVQADYPDTARTVFAAANADRTAVLSFAIADSSLDAAAAAKQASETILGSDTTTQAAYGENSCASFVCAIGDDVYSLHFLSAEGKLLVVGTSGVSQTEIEAMLTGLIF